MKPIRLPVVASNAEDTDTKGADVSPKYFPPMLSAGGGHRRLSIGGEPLGCLALLDAGTQRERPRVFPSAGEILPMSVKAQPTIHVHRPRAVLSSPDNDELICEQQGQQGSKIANSNQAPRAVLSSCEDLPHAPLSSIEDLAPLLPSKEVIKAAPLPSYDLVSMDIGNRDVLFSDNTSSCSTSSNWERTDESSEVSNELVDRRGNRAPSSAATHGRKCMREPSPENQREQNDSEANLSRKPTENRVDRKDSSLPTNTPRRPARQVPKTGSKGSKVRVLRPWY